MPSQWMGERRGEIGSRSTSQATPPSSSHWPACGATCSLPCGRWLVGHWVHLPLLSPLRPRCQPRAATLCSLVVRGRRPTTLLSLPVGADCWSGGIDGTRGACVRQVLPQLAGQSLGSGRGATKLGIGKRRRKARAHLPPPFHAPGARSWPEHAPLEQTKALALLLVLHCRRRGGR